MSYIKSIVNYVYVTFDLYLRVLTDEVKADCFYNISQMICCIAYSHVVKV